MKEAEEAVPVEQKQVPELEDLMSGLAMKKGNKEEVSECERCVCVVRTHSCAHSSPPLSLSLSRVAAVCCSSVAGGGGNGGQGGGKGGDKGCQERQEEEVKSSGPPQT